jgi:hypothetical protein
VDIVVNGGKLLKLAHYIVRSWPAQRANGFTRQLLAVAILKRSLLTTTARAIHELTRNHSKLKAFLSCRFV